MRDSSEGGAICRGRCRLLGKWVRRTYGMSSVFGAVKVNHTVKAGVGSATTLIPMWIEFFLREHVAARLLAGKRAVSKLDSRSIATIDTSCVKMEGREFHTSQEKDTMISPLYGMRSTGGVYRVAKEGCKV